MSFQEVELGSVCRVVPGFAFKSKDLGNEGIQVLKIGNISDDRSVDMSFAQRFPDSLIEDRHKKFFVRDKNIVIAMTGATAGKVGRLRTEEQVLLNQRVAKIEPKRINPDFLWIALSSPKYRNMFFHLAGGAAQPNMSGKQIEKVTVPLPNTLIQSQIAEILSTYDDLIENNRRRITLLEKAARELYKEWFVRLRFPGHEHVAIVNGVPEGWEKRQIKEILTLNYGKALKADDRIKGEFPVYGSSGIIGYHNKALVKGPGIIVGRKGNVGKIHWSYLDYHPIDTVYYVDSKDSSFFIYQTLFNTYFLNTDVAVPGLNRDFAYSREIIVPTEPFRESFQAEAVPVYRQVNLLQTHNTKLAQARDLLLPKLMSGEVAV